MHMQFQPNQQQTALYQYISPAPDLSSHFHLLLLVVVRGIADEFGMLRAQICHSQESCVEEGASAGRGKDEKKNVRGACDVMDMLRRASYLHTITLLRRIVIAHDAYTSSMTVRTRSRPVSWRRIPFTFNACIPVAGVPSVVSTLAKSEKGIL